MKQQHASNTRIKEAIQDMQKVKSKYADVWDEVENGCNNLPHTPTVITPTVEEYPNENKIIIKWGKTEFMIEGHPEESTFYFILGNDMELVVRENSHNFRLHWADDRPYPVIEINDLYLDLKLN